MSIPRYDHPGDRGEAVPTSPSHYPGMVALHNHLKSLPGMSSLGLYNNRSVRGGTSSSLHAVSRACDIGYDSRAHANAAISWLVANASALHLQAILDEGNTHPDHGTVARSWGFGQGWHWSHIGSTHGPWLHVELNIDGARDANLLAGLGHSPSSDAPPKATGPGHVLDSVPNHSLAEGDSGADVILLQQTLQAWHRAVPGQNPNPGAADGRFGPRTKAALKAFQRAPLDVAPDGRYGPITHLATANLAKFLAAHSR